jgi:hypothetical protein
MKDPSPAQWIEEINQGLEFRRRFGVEDEWAKTEALFYGVDSTLKDQSGPNVVASTGDSFLSELSIAEPYIEVKALQPQFVAAAPVLERLDNNLLDDLNVAQAFEDADFFAFLWGKGVLKVGYDSEFGYSPKFDVQEGLGATLTQFGAKGGRIESAFTRPGMPWVSAVLPHDLCVPWGTRYLELDARWVAHRIVRHIDEVKADPKYSSKRSLKPTLSMQDWISSYQQSKQPYRVGEPLRSPRVVSNEVEYVELWEVHDRMSGKIFVVSSHHDSFLRNEKDLLQIEGELPFVDVSFVPRARSFWVTPDAHYLLAHQAELTDIAIQTTKQRRASVLRFLSRRGSIKQDELDKLLSGDVGVCAFAEESGQPLGEVLMPLQPYSGNQQLAMDAEYVRRNAREVVGFSRNQMGEFESKGRRTATEASYVARGASSRTGRRFGVKQRSYGQLIRKLNNIVFAFWTTPMVVALAGAEGEQQWVEFVGSKLRGHYTYKVNLTSAYVPSLQERKMEALQLYQMLSQDPAVDQMGLRKTLIGAFNDPTFTSNFKPEVVQNAQMPQMQGGSAGAPQSGNAR